MISKALLFLITIYQKYISPIKGRTCKYYPHLFRICPASDYDPWAL